MAGLGQSVKSFENTTSRRSFLSLSAMAAASALAGCASTSGTGRMVGQQPTVARQPELAKYSIENGGMEPGLKNPLGARALYIFSNGEDMLYRLCGHPEWRSIGKAVSSGCVRLLNQDIIDLYDRVPIKALIVVKQ